MSHSVFKVSRSGGGSLRGWNRRPAGGRWSRKAPASEGCSVGSEPHLMRVIKTLKQAWRREPEEPSIGAPGRKYADLP